MTECTDTKRLYSEAYMEGGHYTSAADPKSDSHEMPIWQLACISKYIGTYAPDPKATVVEVGCGLGHLHSCHKNWCGIEYSDTAVNAGRKLYGESLKIYEGDARALPLAADSVDLLFSFFAYEHVPQVERAFDEVLRVLKPGGVAVLCPAWHCRAWTVKKLQQRRYSDLAIAEKLGKVLIPLRDSVFFRLLCVLPSRIWREFRMRISSGPIELDYRTLQPRYDLWGKYPHIPDDDAVASIDSHAALAYFASRKWRLISHPSFIKRFACRGGEFVVGKPNLPTTS